MANDRLVLVCRNCGKRTNLAKYYPSNYGVWDETYLAQFIDTHIGCSPLCGSGDLGDDRCFDIYTEKQFYELLPEKIKSGEWPDLC